MKRTAAWLLPVCCVYSVQEYTSTLHTAVARLLPVRLLCYLQRMPTTQGHALPYPLSEVMGNQIRLPSFDTYTTANSSAVKKKQRKKLSRSLIEIKGPEIVKMVLSIAILSINTVPTYYTQHHAYSRERAILIKKLERFTILTALISDFDARYPGYRVIVVNDHNHYLLFQVTVVNPIKTEPPDSTGLFPSSTQDSNLASPVTTAASASASATSTDTPLLPGSPNTVHSSSQLQTRDSDGRFAPGATPSPNPFAHTESGEEKADDGELLHSTHPALPIIPSAPTTPRSPDLFLVPTYEETKHRIRQKDNSDAGGRMVQQWLGDHHGQRNHLLQDVEESGIDPLENPIEALIFLDMKLLSGTYHTLEDEK